MLAVVHCTVTAMLNLQTEHRMASQIDFDRNAEQLPIELASVVGTAARLHMLSASSQVTSRSWVGRRHADSSVAHEQIKLCPEWLHAQQPCPC
jgi:hypothetical protein